MMQPVRKFFGSAGKRVTSGIPVSAMGGGTIFGCIYLILTNRIEWYSKATMVMIFAGTVLVVMGVNSRISSGGVKVKNG